MPTHTLAGKIRPDVEALEDRLTPSGNAVLPAFYQALLNRAPDYPGASGFANQLASGVPSGAVAYEIETSPSQEYYRDLVQSYYVRFLHRQGSPLELQGYANQLAAGATNEQIQGKFLGSQEYYQLHGGDNTTWLNGVYMDLLGRLDTEGAHLGDLQNGGAREAVALNIMYGQAKEYAIDQVSAYYQQFLGRSGLGDPGALNFAHQLQTGQMTDEAIIAALLGSAEFLTAPTPTIGSAAHS